MASEASTVSGQPRPSHIGTSLVESTKNTCFPGQPLRAKGWPPINQDVIRYMDARIIQLITIIAQMVANLSQVNEMPVPNTMQELDLNIPRLNEMREELDPS